MTNIIIYIYNNYHSVYYNGLMIELLVYLINPND